MFKFFKKKKDIVVDKSEKFEIELTATILAYEIARSDGDISKSELDLLLNEVKKITSKVNKSQDEILEIIETYSKNSVSFHEFIEDINKDYSKEEKLSLIKYLWDVAYADNILEVSEERLIRRIADLIKIKDVEVLKLKDSSKNHKTNNL
ncbi:MAG: TerB family tellurite resistance protein [Gammaproteobacteria bacterium]